MWFPIEMGDDKGKWKSEKRVLGADAANRAEAVAFGKFGIAVVANESAAATK